MSEKCGTLELTGDEGDDPEGPGRDVFGLDCRSAEFRRMTVGREKARRRGKIRMRENDGLERGRVASSLL